MPPGTLGEDKANEIIMAARAHWFEGEDEAKDDGETTDGEDGEDGEEGDAPAADPEPAA